MQGRISPLLCLVLSLSRGIGRIGHKLGCLSQRRAMRGEARDSLKDVCLRALAESRQAGAITLNYMPKP